MDFDLLIKGGGLVHGSGQDTQLISLSSIRRESNRCPVERPGISQRERSVTSSGLKMYYTIVNGAVVCEDGEMTGVDMSGDILRTSSYVPTA